MTLYVYHDENGFYLKDFSTIEDKDRYEKEEMDYQFNFIGDEEQFISEAEITILSLKNKDSGDYKAILRE